MNIEQKAHNLAIIAAKYYVENNDEYKDMDKKDIMSYVISDLSSTYDDAYNQIIKDSKNNIY